MDKQIRLIGRTAQFPKISETIEVLQSEFAEIGLNVKIEMMDTAGQLQYQLRPLPGERRTVPADDHARQPGR